ncbi:hypothetical protein [Silvibacterium sp.]|uniref:hypothetical protein n=1 Tax=Silvibacterium sp. TaxID=1964179 RepID=UPI0039E27CBE
MKKDSSVHLTEEALNDALIGMSSTEEDLHLAACELCRAKLQAFESDMLMFDEASLAWSEARSATMPAIEVQRKRHSKLFFNAAWAISMALVLLVCLPTLHFTHVFSLHRHGSLTTAGDSESQIAQDNELLQAVDVAVNADDLSSMGEYSTSTRIHPHSGLQRSAR